MYRLITKRLFSTNSIPFDYRLGNINYKKTVYNPGLGINTNKEKLSKCYCFSDKRKISNCYCLTDFYKNSSSSNNINLKNRNNLF